MIKVYGVPMSRAMRVLWALEEVGASYELVPTNFVTDARAPAYLQINPNGRIPARSSRRRSPPGSVTWSRRPAATAAT